MTPAFAVEAHGRPAWAAFAVPNGIMNLQNEFLPKEAGAIELSPILQPLADFKDRVLTFSGPRQSSRPPVSSSKSRATIRALAPPG